jgi:hypothetical protein
MVTGRGCCETPPDALSTTSVAAIAIRFTMGAT